MKTEIIAILDRSGSMGHIAAESISGFNNFVKEQKAVPGEAKMTTVLFDDKYEVIYQGVPLDHVPKLTNDQFFARGYTALYDAVGKTLESQGKRIAAEAASRGPWADKVIVVILTDGAENASKEYTSDRVKVMTKHAEKHGWKFVFLAANIDASSTAASFGISQQFVGNYRASGSGTQAAYASISGTLRSLRVDPNAVSAQGVATPPSTPTGFYKGNGAKP